MRLLIDVSDSALQQGLQECETLEDKQDYVEDMAEIGSRVTEHCSQSEQTTDILRMLQEQRRQDQEQHERQTQALEKSHQRQLAELEAQRQREREDEAEQMKRLSETLAVLSAQLDAGGQREQAALQQLQSGASTLMAKVGQEVVQALRERNQDSDKLVGVIQSTLDRATEGVKEHIHSASLLLQTYQDREEARLEADRMKDKTSHLKGMLFEDRLFQELSDFADHRGDRVEHTGNYSEGGTASKKGDLLYTLQTADGSVRIAIEAKDKTLRRRGKNPYFLKELRASKLERGATYGLVVGSFDENTNDQGEPNFMPLKDLQDGNYAVLVDEERATPIALLAAIQMISSLENHGEDRKLAAERVGEVQSRLQRISELSGNLRSMKGSAKNLKTNLTTLEETLGTFDRELKREIRGLETLLKS